MAFLRFTRDRRGYEHFSLVEPPRGRSGAPRVLYWFRTPPNVRVGREPFDEALRRRLEAEYPGVTFDWRRILDTPIPSADAERWRERRRQEKAEKAAKRAREGRAESDDEADDEGGGGDAAETDDMPAEPAAAAPEPAEEDAIADAAPPDVVAATTNAPVQGTGTNAPVQGNGSGRRRRRRRGRRGRRGGGDPV